jgi:para-aminobenzoate synthetase component I
MPTNIINNLRLEMNALGSKSRPFFLMIDFDLQQPVLIPLDEMTDDYLIDMPLFSNVKGGDIQFKDFVFEKRPVSFTAYVNAFNKVIANIRHGNSYLVNLTFPTEISTNLTLEQIFYLSRAKYRLMLKNRFVVFSPEIFVRIKDDRIFSYPMKGTIDASIPGAEKIIMNDKKELAEHNTIVDLIRNDLSIVSNNVEVTRYRYLDLIETNSNSLLQVSSEIRGELKKGWKSIIGDILFPLLPAGSVSGAPKQETLRIIRESEDGSRGYYTGICGIFNGREFDSCVMIRYVEQTGDNYVYRSGGGVTSLSEANSEYEELISKIYVPTG